MVIFLLSLGQCSTKATNSGKASEALMDRGDTRSGNREGKQEDIVGRNT